MNKIIITLFLLILSAGLWAQDTLRLNLELCREMALENSISVQIAGENIHKALGEKQAARSAWFPNISASASGLYSKNEIQTELMLPTKSFDMATGELVPNVASNPITGQPVLGSDGNPVFNMYAFLPLDITLYGGAIAGVSAEQPIYAGGKIVAGNRMAEIGENLSLKNKKLKEDESLLEASQMYYNYLSVKEKLKLAKEYRTLLRELTEVTEDSYEMGMVNRNKLLNVQVKYQETSLQLQKAESGLELARMALCRAIGVDLSTLVAINDRIDNIVLNPDSVAQVSARERLEYKMLEGQVDMAEQELQMVKGDYLPTAGISAGYNYFNIALEGMDNYDSHGFNALATINIPITTFGEKKGKIASVKANQHIRMLELRQAQQYLQLEMEQARLNYIDAYKRIELAQKVLEQAEENMRVSDDNYELGMETLANVLEAKAEWQKAYSNKIDALSDFRIKESRFLKLTNNLNTN